MWPFDGLNVQDKIKDELYMRVAVAAAKVVEPGTNVGEISWGRLYSATFDFSSQYDFISFENSDPWQQKLLFGKRVVEEAKKSSVMSLIVEEVVGGLSRCIRINVTGDGSEGFTNYAERCKSLEDRVSKLEAVLSGKEAKPALNKSADPGDLSLDQIHQAASALAWMRAQAKELDPSVGDEWTVADYARVITKNLTHSNDRVKDPGKKSKSNPVLGTSLKQPAVIGGVE